VYDNTFCTVPLHHILQYLERHNGPYVVLFHENSIVFGAHYVKVVKDTPTLSVAKMQPKESSF